MISVPASPTRRGMPEKRFEYDKPVKKGECHVIAAE
jgi:hypothetical protein